MKTCCLQYLSVLTAYADILHMVSQWCLLTYYPVISSGICPAAVSKGLHVAWCLKVSGCGGTYVDVVSVLRRYIL